MLEGLEDTRPAAEDEIQGGAGYSGPACDRAIFFFQAEDGIRDDLVTGDQTCALPISSRSASPRSSAEPRSRAGRSTSAARPSSTRSGKRSEERRVGKECTSRWPP